MNLTVPELDQAIEAELAKLASGGQGGTDLEPVREAA
jgi:hypothetical protein